MRRLALLLLFFACKSSNAQLQRPSGPAVGLAWIEPLDPLTSKRLSAMVLYPPVAPREGTTAVGPYLLEAEEGLPVAEGLHPLIVISHGHKGSRFGHHDLAEHLARLGYVVAAVEHAGDSWNDQSGFGSDRVLLGRAYQVSALIDAVLADPRLAPYVDPTRIGAAGFSAGGYTSLLLVGAEPDFSLVGSYCERHPSDDEICSVREMKRTITTPRPTMDPRVKAAFVMAPFGIVFAGPDAFAHVMAPVWLATAEKDSVLLPSEHADPVRERLKTLAGDTRIAGADHYVFIAPCSADLASVAAVLCEDPPGIDRRSVHAKLNAEAATFFDGALKASPTDK